MRAIPLAPGDGARYIACTGSDHRAGMETMKMTTATKMLNAATASARAIMHDTPLDSGSVEVRYTAALRVLTDAMAAFRGDGTDAGREDRPAYRSAAALAQQVRDALRNGACRAHDADAAGATREEHEAAWQAVRAAYAADDAARAALASA
jgi:cation transport regulator ChaB